MTQLPLHRHYLHYSELPYSQRVLYTATLLILGLGYLSALLNVYFTYAGRGGGNPYLLSVQDIVVAYSGSGKGSKLESALMGPMSTMLPPDDRGIILRWVQEGSLRAAFDRDVKPIFDKRCLSCHDGSNPHLPNLSSFDDVKKVTEQDTGASISTPVRVSHIHLFGLPFIFFIVGLMFTHAYVRPVWLKCAIVALPFAAMGRCELVVFYQAFPPVCLGRHIIRRRDGRVLRLHVARHALSTVVHAAAGHGDATRARRRSGDRLSAEKSQALSEAPARQMTRGFASYSRRMSATFLLAGATKSTRPFHRA